MQPATTVVWLRGYAAVRANINGLLDVLEVASTDSETTREFEIAARGIVSSVAFETLRDIEPAAARWPPEHGRALPSRVVTLLHAGRRGQAVRRVPSRRGSGVSLCAVSGIVAAALGLTAGVIQQHSKTERCWLPLIACPRGRSNAAVRTAKRMRYGASAVPDRGERGERP